MIGNLKRAMLFVAAILIMGFVFVVHWMLSNNILDRINLFHPDKRVENFRSIDEFYNTLPISKPIVTSELKYGDKIALPETFEFRGETRDVGEYFSKTDTTGLLVMSEGHILFEEYYLGASDHSRLVSMSVAKSFVSALIGIAIEEGLIHSSDNLVTEYLPYLEGSAFADVTIEHVLQMSSGVSFSEAYDDMGSDINQLVAASVIWGQPIAKFPQHLGSDYPPGTYFNYSSMDTQILGMIIEEVTGLPLTAYIESKLWKPLGMESDASWVADGKRDDSVVFAFCCMNAVLRDYARFGQLYLQSGEWDGQQIVPSEWVRKSTVPDLEYPSLKKHYATPDWEFGYQYQWWIPQSVEGEYMAIGVWGQYIYVNPTTQTVIVKTSVDPGHGGGDMETLQVFRTIVDSLAE